MKYFLHTFNPPVEQQEESGLGRSEANPHFVDVDERVEPCRDGTRSPGGSSCWPRLTGTQPTGPEGLGQHVGLQVSLSILNLKLMFSLSQKTDRSVNRARMYHMDPRQGKYVEI